MNSDATKEFWELYRVLPEQVRQQAQATYQMFCLNPRHPGLHFKCVNDKYLMYSARVGLQYRVLGFLEDDLVTWWWIGTHTEYDKILDQI